MWGVDGKLNTDKTEHGVFVVDGVLRMAQMDEMDSWQWTGNGIGDGGAIALSHVLESEEAVLASISLYGVSPFLSNSLICGCVCMRHAL